MGKSFDEIIADYTKYGLIYSDFSDKYSKRVQRKAGIGLYRLGEDLKKNPEQARMVIDELIHSPNIGAVCWIATLAISIVYREQEAIDILHKIYADKDNGLIGMLAKAALINCGKFRKEWQL